MMSQRLKNQKQKKLKKEINKYHDENNSDVSSSPSQKNIVAPSTIFKKRFFLPAKLKTKMAFIFLEKAPQEHFLPPPPKRLRCFLFLAKIFTAPNSN
jgi:hypothetical protein